MEKENFHERGVTLNILKDELHSLNRRMLLAVQIRDEEEQTAIQREIEEVQEKIGRLSFRGPSSG